MALSSINTSGITVGNDGKLKVSGFSSGIDWKTIIESTITAKRAPAITLEAKITDNKDKITAYQDLKTKVAAVTTALDALRAAPGSSTDVFKTKTVSGSSASSPDAPNGHTASSVDSLLLVSVDSTAQSATHTIEIHQLAQAHQIRADAISSTTSSLTSQGVTAGTFTINGKNIVVGANDTMLDLRAAINNAGAGVTATIVSSDSSHNYLVLTSNTAGDSNKISLGGDAATLSGLGLSADGGTTVKNQLTAAQNAIIDVDGITGIERSTNQIDDVISGVTLSLTNAEENTIVTLKVEPDLSTIKTAISDFVTAYNDLRTFYTDQRTASDRDEDGTVDDNEYGPLAYDTTLKKAMNGLSDLASTYVDSAADGYQSLGQIGVTMSKNYQLEISDSTLDNKLLTGIDEIKKLFTLQTSVSDSRVTVLATGDATKTGTYYLSIGGTDADGNVTSGRISKTAGSGTADDGSLTINGKMLTATDTTDADGLALYFKTGANMGAVTDVQVTVSRGIADSFYDLFSSISKSTTGQIDTVISDLQTQNNDYKTRIDTIDTRLEVARTNLENKYAAMETALSKLTTLQNTIDSYFNNDSSSN